MSRRASHAVLAAAAAATLPLPAGAFTDDESQSAEQAVDTITDRVYLEIGMLAAALPQQSTSGSDTHWL